MPTLAPKHEREATFNAISKFIREGPPMRIEMDAEKLENALLYINGNPRKDKPAPLKPVPTGVWPAWIPADEFVPHTPRVVLATDEEGVFTACYEGGEWVDAQTEEPFDSVIAGWMEQPPACVR